MIKNPVVYQIFVRNHGLNGNFADVSADLPRIRQMGADAVLFLPIHPIGEQQRVGILGNPFAPQSLADSNPEYGTKEEFRLLVQYAHALGLKVLLNVVCAQSAPDSQLAQAHPSWLLQENGRFKYPSPIHRDAILLDHSQPGLAGYLISYLKVWAEVGVDGFWCHDATQAPLPFWQQARQELSAINPALWWIADVSSKSERLLPTEHPIYKLFDWVTVFDKRPLWYAAMEDETAVSAYLAATASPNNLIFGADHYDQPRLMQVAPSRAQAMAWLAFEAFRQGGYLIYAGQEAENRHTPSLFDMDKVHWADYSMQLFLTKLCQLKKSQLQEKGVFELLSDTPVITAVWRSENGLQWGAFNVQGVIDVMPTPLPDGQYVNLLSELSESFEVRDGEMVTPETAVVVELRK